MKASRYAADYILCEYTLQTDGQTLDAVESVQMVRAVWTGDEWELHFVCKMRIETADVLGEKTAGVDLGICNTATVSVGDETLLSHIEYKVQERGIDVERVDEAGV